MNATQKKLNFRSYALIAMALLFCMTIATSFASKIVSYASEFETITLNNGNFSSASGHSLATPSGWTILGTKPEYARAGIIDVTPAAFASYGTSTTESSSYYMLNTQPTKMNPSFDDKVLMLNARDNSYNFGYKSSQVSLTASSYYVITVLARAEENATFSMYISGLTEENDSRATYTGSSQVWNEYKFFVSTSLEPLQINIELWIGSRIGSTSKNAVFFDNISIKKTSHNFYNTDLLNNYAGSVNKEINLKSEENYFVPAGYTNTNFETAVSNPYPLAETSVGANAAGNFVQIRSLNTSIEGTLFGTNLRYQNNKGLVMHSETSSAFGVILPSFDIPFGSIMKITVSMKVSSPMTGSAYMRFVEEETTAITEAFPSYTLKNTKSTQLSSNATNLTTNNYTNVSFLVKANTLINSKAHLEFWIGDTSAKAVGTVVFDDLTFQTISYSEYEGSIASATKIDLTTITGTPSIANGALNSYENETNTLTYPVKPASFSRVASDETLVAADTKIFYGIINTNQAHFNAQGYDFINPGALFGQQTDFATGSNNVLMVQNKVVTYQTLATQVIDLSANTTYEISFQMRASGNANASLVNSSNVVIANMQQISSPSEFSVFKFVVRVGSSPQTVTLRFGVGSIANPASGTAFFDNFALKTVTYTNEAFSALQPTNSLRIADLKNGLFSKGSVSELDSDIYTPTFLNGTLTGTETSSVAHGGIIDGTNPLFDLPSTFTNTNQNVLFIRNQGSATYTLTSNLTEVLAANKYYRISVWVKTVLSNPDELTDVGATLTANASNASFDGILTNGEFTEYVFMQYGTSSKNIAMAFGLVSSDNSVNGYALFTQPVIEELTQTTFNAETKLLDLEFPPTNIINLSTEVPAEEGEDEAPGFVAQPFDFLLLPSLILAVALIVAVVGFSMRRIKFRKLQFKYKSSYDRSKTLSSNVLRKEAEAIKKTEVAALQTKLDAATAALTDLETGYAQTLKLYRDARDTLPKEEIKAADAKQEKLFKTYSAAHTRLEQQVLILNDKLADMESVEYIMSLERRVVRNQKKAAKAAKEVEKSKLEAKPQQDLPSEPEEE